MKLTDFDTLTFDCYGTLIDWESGMVEGLRSLTGRMRESLSRDQILQAHARHESAQQAWTPARPYRELLAIVYKRLAEEWGVETSWADCEAYGDSVKDWPAFADSAEALAYLKSYYRLVILSNVDNRSFSHSQRKLGVAFDAVYTAEDIGSYKPAARNFDYMMENLKGLGVEKGRILHTAESLFHDHTPANAAGLKSCWIFRRHAQSGFGATMDPGQLPHVDFRFDSMADLVAAHRAEMR
ncbi:haloacid dehalogenase type II [Aureimonas altamirensis]|uniref:haloacid dehalogenase type II n=1 Tax=Aureimonas altamirensis TaxID=370622 RepID=UPI002036AB96|nr:haloacid dehalogenase type II [Aureimonas altamirensis]MCM2505768.1 haloacid dehalogenase type II [Aureimonas altamirensis]